MTYEEFYREDGSYPKDSLLKWFRSGGTWEDDSGREYKQMMETVTNPEISSKEVSGILSGYIFTPNENPTSIQIATVDGIRGMAPALAYRTSDGFTLIFF